MLDNTRESIALWAKQMRDFYAGQAIADRDAMNALVAGWKAEADALAIDYDGADDSAEWEESK